MLTLHVLWMCGAVAIGTTAGYLGLLRSGLIRRLPGRFSLRWHVVTGVAYYVLLAAGLVISAITQAELARHSSGEAAIVRWHGGMGGAAMVLYVVAGVLGIALAVRWSRAGGQTEPRGLLGRGHMILNYSACTLVGATMLTGVLLTR